MANQKLSDKDYHLDPVNSDFIHSVDISDTTDSTEGTSKKLTWATIKDTLFSFLKLRDVNDSTYVGKTGFVPAVTYNSLGVPELKLTTLPTYTDLLGGNAIIRGGVIYSGSGLDYTIYASKYIINNQVYTDYVSDTVTLSDGDATNSRIDVFAVEITADDPPVASIVVVEGTPAVSPIKPSLNLSTQVEVSFKLVLDNETTDPDFTAELIYNENLGETAEWDNILLATSGNLSYTTAPYNGTYSLYLPATTSGTTKWQKDAMFAHDAEGSLNFAMKFPEAVETNPKIELELINSSDSKYFRFVLTVESLRDYGFDVTSNAWQLIRVPLNEFVSDSRVPPTEYDILSIKTIKSPVINLDVINIIGGVVNPTNAQSVLEVVAGTNVTVDSSDPLRPIVSATGGEGIYNTKVSLTAAQVKTLFSVPVVLVPAPGVGKAIIPIRISIKINFNSVAFNAPLSTYIIIDTAAYRVAQVSPTVLNSSSDLFDLTPLEYAASTQIVENKGLLIQNTTSDPTLGDGSVDIYITYQTIDI